MIAKILGTEKDPVSVNALENYAKKYIFHPYISFSIRFYCITCHIKVLFGARKFFSVLFGGKSPFLSSVGPSTKYAVAIIHIVLSYLLSVLLCFQ